MWTTEKALLLTSLDINIPKELRTDTQDGMKQVSCPGLRRLLASLAFLFKLQRMGPSTSSPVYDGRSNLVAMAFTLLHAR